MQQPEAWEVHASVGFGATRVTRFPTREEANQAAATWCLGGKRRSAVVWSVARTQRVMVHVMTGEEEA